MESIVFDDVSFTYPMIEGDLDAEGKQIWTDKETEQLRVLRREIEKAWGASL